MVTWKGSTWFVPLSQGMDLKTRSQIEYNFEA